jgi:hypothetical protein
MSTQGYYNKNTGLILIEGENGGPVIRELDGSVLTMATGNITDIRTLAGDSIGGETFPVAVTEQAPPNEGQYYAYIAHTLAVTTGDQIVVIVDMLSGGLVGHWETPAVVVENE